MENLGPRKLASCSSTMGSRAVLLEGKIPFFQYTIKLGHHTLAVSKGGCLLRQPFGNKMVFNHISWTNSEQLWARNQPCRIITCQWLIAHRALPIGEWMSKIGKLSHCPLCDYQMEILVHRFWTCPQAI